MKLLPIIFVLFLNVTFFTRILHAEVEIKLDTTIIKGNTELPKILYIVPWKEIRQMEHDEQQFVIHSLYGDLFDPVIPELVTVVETGE